MDRMCESFTLLRETFGGANPDWTGLCYAVL